MPWFVCTIQGVYCDGRRLPKASRAATHDLALADELGVEFGTVERKVDVKVDTVEGSLRSVHTFEVLFEVFAGEVRSQSYNLLYALKQI